MEFYEVINKRRSIRQFEDREIPRDVLERILDAGLKAPSSNHQRRWELVTLTEKPMIMELAKFIKPYPCRIQEPKSPQQEMFKIAYPRQRTMIEESACVILPWFQQKYPLRNVPQGVAFVNSAPSVPMPAGIPGQFPPLSRSGSWLQWFPCSSARRCAAP